MILSLGATFSQSFGPNGATSTRFGFIFMVLGYLICEHVSQCQPEAFKKTRFSYVEVFFEPCQLCFSCCKLLLNDFFVFLIQANFFLPQAGFGMF